MSRIRMLCYQDDIVFDGDVEVDETYLAAGKWHRHTSYKKGRNVPVLGILKRGGKVVLRVLPNKKTIQRIILKHVECGSRLITDSAACYFNMENYYIHETVNHREGEYVRDDVYTNGIENVWHNFKKAILGVHHSVSILHLQRYCDEFSFRWNTKELTPLQKFNYLLKRGCDTKPFKNNMVSLGASHIASDVKKKNKYTQSDFDTSYVISPPVTLI